ncbi:MAG: DNA polymerase III subunit alpha [candidate division NC10 bacterium]|nr:DNA polymerase III subunit alpha [candidate division NC10 bacterium]
MPRADFVHLHVHSQYSLLDGACHLEKLVRKAHEFKMPALAVTDHGNLFGAIDFYRLAQKEGIKPIIGCEVYVAPGSRLERYPQDGQYEGANHLTLLVRDRTGYKNLIKLVTAGYLEGFYYKPRIDKEVLAQYHEGLLALSGCLNSEVCQLLAHGEEEKACEVAAWHRDLFGRENYFLELQFHGIEPQRAVNQGLLRMAKRLEVPVVVTNDVHYLNAGDHKAHDALVCIQTGKTVADRDRLRFASDQFYLKSPREMADLFPELSEALLNTVAIAERCNLQLDFDKIHLPRYQAPPGHTLDSYLAECSWRGLSQRYGQIAEEVKARLTRELEVIEKIGFAGYFLIVWDFIRFAKDRGISVGPGRGSAAGSLVAYALGITNIDPLRYGLLFERFLNPERISPPDMDIDFADDRRDEVIGYVAQKYGKENVAQIITFGTLGAKAVIRDVGRALGMPYGEVDKIAKMVPNVLNISLDEAIAQSPPLREAVRSRPEVNDLWEIARTLEGLTRHASTHAAGVVISGEPLIEHVPLYRGTKGEITTQYAMGAIEKIGLLKMDFLGLRTLTVISNTLKLLKETRGVDLQADQIPFDDAQTFTLLSEARTSGVFQLESAGMRDLLRRLRPERLEDVIALVALYRPGPMEMIPDFINRRHGRVKINYDHPLMEKYLKETYGVMVYQEQVMQIASEMAGFTMGEADILRRAMGKKNPELMARQREKFVDRTVTRHVPRAKAERIFDLMAQFAGYGFNKSHAAAYAVVAYQTAYLKANYPMEFMAALCTSEMGDTDKTVKYIEECRQMGIEILPPDVNESGSTFRVVGDKIRFGLVAVKNLGETAIQSILNARTTGGKFSSLHDFCERVDLRLVNKRVIESLIKCGAFDSLGYRRSQLMAAVDQAMDAASVLLRDRAKGQVSLLEMLEGGVGRAKTPQLHDMPEWSHAQRLTAEREIIGFYITGHPLSEYEALRKRHATVTTEELGSLRDKEMITLCGIITAVKEISTKSGDRMAFVTIEDLRGSVESIVFPDLYRGRMLALVKDNPVLVKGQVDIGEEAVKLLLTEVRPLSDLQQEPEGELEIALRAEALSGEILRQIRTAVEGFAGPVPLRLRLHLDRATAVVIEAGEGLTVRPVPELVSALERIAGPGSVAIRVGAA